MTLTSASPVPTITIPRKAKPMPKLWATFPVGTGTTIQLVGVAGGLGLVWLAAATHPGKAAGVALLIAGWLAIYLCSHAVAHVAVGRAVGIRFRAYGVRGTDHPENYPPGLRQLMSALPMWSALTDKASMRQAHRWAKAAMFAAGETSTSLCSIAAAAWAAHAGVPGAHTVLTGSVLWAVSASITVTVIAKGDYAKALRALRTH
jgi:hypothetical protein